MTDEEWTKAIILHLTGKPDEPSPMLVKMIADIRAEARDSRRKLPPLNKTPKIIGNFNASISDY